MKIACRSSGMLSHGESLKNSAKEKGREQVTEVSISFHIIN